MEGADSEQRGLIGLHADPGRGKKAGGPPWAGEGRVGRGPRRPGGSPAGGWSWQSPGTGVCGGSPVPVPGSGMGSAETKAGGEQKTEGNKGDSCGVAGLAADWGCEWGLLIC